MRYNVRWSMTLLPQSILNSGSGFRTQNWREANAATVGSVHLLIRYTLLEAKTRGSFAKDLDFTELHFILRDIVF